MEHHRVVVRQSTVAGTRRGLVTGAGPHLILIVDAAVLRPRRRAAAAAALSVAVDPASVHLLLAPPSVLTLWRATSFHNDVGVLQLRTFRIFHDAEEGRCLERGVGVGPTFMSRPVRESRCRRVYSGSRHVSRVAAPTPTTCCLPARAVHGTKPFRFALTCLFPSIFTHLI